MLILDASSTRDIQDRLGRLTPESAAVWGKMNAHQMVCHLLDSFGLAMGTKSASEVITPMSRTLIRWLALRVPMHWPKGVPTRPEMDQHVGGTPPVEFLQDRAALSALIGRFAVKPRDFEFARHPVFGPMSEWEWMRWGYLHADHHFRQFGV